MEVPTGWVQILRGPRPPSQKWPIAQPMQRPRQPRVSPVPQGPRVPTVRVSPDGSHDAARQKVEKLQQALAVMEDTGGVAVECLKAELEKAKKASQKPPLNVEVGECRKFIARSEKRVADLDRERESELSVLTDAKARLQRLEAEQTVPMALPADWKAQIEALQAQ